MRKFWGLYKNDKFIVGCNGSTVYVYDTDWQELVRFKDFPYAYNGAFKPGSNVIAVKSTEGYLGFYDLDSLSLIKKIVVTRIGAQDEGFAFSKDGRLFYNIEKPVYSTRTQLGIYETTTYSKIQTLFENDTKMVLNDLEFDSETDCCYVYGFLRNDEGVYENGFVAVFKQNKQSIENIKHISKADYDYLFAYKHWENSGFSEKACWSELKEQNPIRKISIKELYMKYD